MRRRRSASRRWRAGTWLLFLCLLEPKTCRCVVAAASGMCAAVTAPRRSARPCVSLLTLPLPSLRSTTTRGRPKLQPQPRLQSKPHHPHPPLLHRPLLLPLHPTLSLQTSSPALPSCVCCTRTPTSTPPQSRAADLRGECSKATCWPPLRASPLLQCNELRPRPPRQLDQRLQLQEQQAPQQRRYNTT